LTTGIGPNIIVLTKPAKAMGDVHPKSAGCFYLSREKKMPIPDKVKIQADLNGEVLDNKDKYVIRGGHIYVKAEQLLQSSKVKRKIEQLRETFLRSQNLKVSQV